MTFPGLSGIRFTEYSGGPIVTTYLPASPQMTAQLGTLNAGSNDFTGVPQEAYDVFYSDANGAFNLNGDYVTIEATFPGTAGGGLNIAAVDMLLGPAPFMICRADILGSSVGLGSNYIAGSELLAVDPDTAPPAAPVTFTTMGNTAGINSRLRVTVGWTKVLVPEPSTAVLMTICALVFGSLARQRK